MRPPAIVIAAGGEGRRIGGAKPRRLLGGRSLLEHALTIAAAQSDCCAIAARDVEQVGRTEVPVLFDAWPALGPINALASAFRFAAGQGRSHVLLIGCDQPFLPRDLAMNLAAAIGEQGAAMPVSAGYDQPMAALWRVDEAALAASIAGGCTSLWRFAEHCDVVRVPWPKANSCDPFANINDPASLAQAERLFGARPDSGERE